MTAVCLACHLIAPNVGEADWFENVNAVDNPAHLWLPVNGFEDTSGR
jgi:hypothetical protein